MGNNITDLIHKIADLIVVYEKLNRIYNLIAWDCHLSFEDLKFMADFQIRYDNSEEIERVVIDLMCGLEKDDPRFGTLLGRLREEIGNNLSLYETNKEAFEEVVSLKAAANRSNAFNIVCKYVEDACNQDIEEQLKVTQKKYKELLEVSNSYECRVFSYKPTDEKLIEVEKKMEDCKQAYEKERAELNKMYEKKQKIQKDAFQYMEQRFDSIYNMGISIRTIIGNYALKEAQDNSMETADTNAAKTSDKTKEKKTIYFNKDLTNSFYNLFVGREFEQIGKIEFNKNLNLVPCNNKLKIKKDKKVYVYYIISLLQKFVREKYGRQWLDDFLKENGIEYKVYNSLYGNAVKTKNGKRISPQKKDFMTRARKCKEIIEDEMY